MTSIAPKDSTDELRRHETSAQANETIIADGMRKWSAAVARAKGNKLLREDQTLNIGDCFVEAIQAPACPRKDDAHVRLGISDTHDGKNDYEQRAANIEQLEAMLRAACPAGMRYQPLCSGTSEVTVVIKGRNIADVDRDCLLLDDDEGTWGTIVEGAQARVEAVSARLEPIVTADSFGTRLVATNMCEYCS